MNRDFKGIWIPKEIWLAEGLTATEKVLWAEINSLYDESKDGCYASNEYLAEFMGVKERTVRDALCKFRQLGLIKDISFDGRQRVIKALQPDDQFCCRLADWRKSASLDGENPQGSVAVNRPSLIYRDTSRDTRLENTPTHPKKTTMSGNPDAEEKNAAIAACVSDSNSQTQKVSKKKAEFIPKVHEVANQMVHLLATHAPVYRPPPDMTDFLTSVQALLEKDKRSPEEILKVFEFALLDSEKRDTFPGWKSHVARNKRKETPPVFLRKYFEQIHHFMESQPKRKFAPSSDMERAMESTRKANERAL